MKKVMLVLAFTLIIFAQNGRAQNAGGSALKQVIDQYLNVKNALTQDDADSVRIYAAALAASIGSVPVESLALGQAERWLKDSANLMFAAVTLQKRSDLKSQRKEFAALSTMIYTVLKNLEATPTDLFYDYCPMSKAFWISETATIVNPYYGQAMSSCGSIKDTLKAHTN